MHAADLRSRYIAAESVATVAPGAMSESSSASCCARLLLGTPAMKPSAMCCSPLASLIIVTPPTNVMTPPARTRWPRWNLRWAWKVSALRYDACCSKHVVDRCAPVLAGPAGCCRSPRKRARRHSAGRCRSREASRRSVQRSDRGLDFLKSSVTEHDALPSFRGLHLRERSHLDRGSLHLADGKLRLASYSSSCSGKRHQ
mmetsp:Transcript_17368/g.53908  ORF Transcript_17368/g.53908 Transcript_17368/m.53908 type:complete len:200 (-) Transcript_17368:641-1240(-)